FEIEETTRPRPVHKTPLIYGSAQGLSWRAIGRIQIRIIFLCSRTIEKLAANTELSFNSPSLLSGNGFSTFPKMSWLDGATCTSGRKSPPHANQYIESF